jgi:hypothetical protein
MNDDTQDNFEGITNFQAVTNKQNISEIESYSEDMDRKRRMILAILSKNADELFEMTEKEVDLTKEMFDQALGYIEHLDTLRELAASCCTRLLISLSGLTEPDQFQEYSKRWSQAVECSATREKTFGK